MSQRRAEQAAARVIAKWLESAAGLEQESRRLHASIARRIRRKIGRRNLDTDDIFRIISAEMRRAEPERIAIIERAIANGVQAGANIPRAVFNAAIVGSRAAVDLVQTKAASIIAGRRLRSTHQFDNRTVIARLRRRTAGMSREAANSLAGSVRAGTAARDAATDLMRAADIRANIPQYIERIDAAARMGDPGELRRVLREEMAALRDSGSLAGQNIASSTRRFIRRVERSQGADIDAALDEWITRRAHNQSFTIARTEGTTAMRAQTISDVEDRDWAVGMRWRLSGAHKREDVCDMLAGQDSHGLGPGGYPKDAVPQVPHPNCTCYQVPIIDEDYSARKRAKREGKREPPKPWETNGSQSGHEWLANQSEEMQRNILGPGRYREFQQRPAKVIQGNRIQPLYRIQDRPRPRRNMGESATVRRAGGGVDRVERDAPLGPVLQTPDDELEE